MLAWIVLRFIECLDRCVFFCVCYVITLELSFACVLWYFEFLDFGCFGCFNA